MNIPKDIILIWDGTLATIPSGWTRETALDGKYPKAWGVQNPNVTGGNATHSHTSPSHSHVIANHTHSVTFSYASHVTGVNSHNWAGQIMAGSSHYHTGTSGSSSNSGTSTGTTAVTYGSVSNNPPYVEVIFVRAGLGTTLRDSINALWSSATLPTGWSENTTARNRYIKGASTGANSGATGGSTQNTHSINHNHTVSAHTHASANSSTALNYVASREHTTTDDTLTSVYHTHAFTLDSASVTMPVESISLTTTETVEPSYIKMVLIKKTSTGIKPKGLIGLWLGSEASIPYGWLPCNGSNGTLDLRDKFIKIANSTAEVGNTGGSNAHTHASQSHTHSSISHNHTVTISNQHVPRTANNNLRPKYQDNTSYTANASDHTATSTASNISFNSATTSANSSDNQPPYLTAMYIQFDKELPSGKILFF